MYVTSLIPQETFVHFDSPSRDLLRGHCRRSPERWREEKYVHFFFRCPDGTMSHKSIDQEEERKQELWKREKRRREREQTQAQIVVYIFV